MFPVRELGGRLIPEQALYRVALSLMEDSGDRFNFERSKRGDVMIIGKAEAIIDQFLRSSALWLMRESGF
ncbi:MAG: hypothetical protein HQM07_04210 [Zetaproteobacteria bacterium]|nr:hypothetical protein [Zetaproteobacteria bacterium]